MSNDLRVSQFNSNFNFLGELSLLKCQLDVCIVFKVISKISLFTLNIWYTIETLQSSSTQLNSLYEFCALIWFPYLRC